MYSHTHTLTYIIIPHVQFITVPSQLTKIPTNVHQRIKTSHALLPPPTTSHGQYLCNANEDVDSIHHDVV